MSSLKTTDLFGNGIRHLYEQILTAWNQRDAFAMAAQFVDDGNLVGFDGSQVDSRTAIEAHLSSIFADHPTAAYVAKVREIMNATGLPVPAEIVAAFGKGKRPKVKVSLNGYTYRSTVAAYGDVFMLPLSQEHREAAGVQAGEQVEVTLELDTDPRTVEVPDVLAAALAENNVRPTFDSLSYTMRKEYVRQVTSAKAEETRQRRIAKIVAQLSEG